MSANILVVGMRLRPSAIDDTRFGPMVYTHQSCSALTISIPSITRTQSRGRDELMVVLLKILFYTAVRGR